ncbi:acyltransferase [Oenococcus oeni]|uniref:acyltransferase n=2 Tax=Oenococcus oeni TaxID=1247 RepID=UPI0009AF5FCC|nr:acyltransferase [Oenococcus oeni]
MLHTSQAIFTARVGTSLFLQVRMFQEIAIPAVFLFFMIFGAMLIDYRQRMSTTDFFKRRIKRVLIPFLFWSILWYFYDIKWSAYPGPISHPYPSVSDFLISFANTNINTIFWFFYVILVLYLVTPMLSAIAKLKEKDYLFLLVSVYVVINCFILYPLEVFKIQINNNMINFPLITFCYLGYFIAGYLIHSGYFSKKQEDLLIVIGFVMFFIQVLLISCGKGLNLDMNSSTGPIVFFYSVGLFTLVKRIMGKINLSSKFSVIFKTMASTSLGIYIIHPLFIRLFDKFFSVNEMSLLHIYIFPFMVYIVCMMLVLLIKRIPGGKYIFP